MRSTAPARPGISTGQMMKFVVLWSGACAAMTPFAILWRIGMMSTGGLLVASAFVMPLALACLSLGLVRRGVWRDRLILIELLISVATGLGIATSIAVLMTRHLLYALANPGSGWPNPVEVLVVVLAIISLTAAVGFLSLRLFRSTCGPHRSHAVILRAIVPRPRRSS